MNLIPFSRVLLGARRREGRAGFGYGGNRMLGEFEPRAARPVNRCWRPKWARPGSSAGPRVAFGRVGRFADDRLILLVRLFAPAAAILLRHRSDGTMRSICGRGSAEMRTS